MNNVKKHNQPQSAKSPCGGFRGLVIVFFFAFSFSAFAEDIYFLSQEEINQMQGEMSLLQQANALYIQGEYLQAINLYERILQEYGVSPEWFSIWEMRISKRTILPAPF